MPRGLFDPVRGPVPRAHERAEGRRVHTVAEITRLIRDAVERSFGDLWVEGEVSNLSRPVSGHVYFTLKDEHAQLQAVVWKGVASRLGFEIKDGDDILVFGQLTVYEPRGQHQIVVSRAELKGLGALQRAYEELREKLKGEGLFDEARKRPVPFLPKVIGIVTSPTGAAIQDMLRVIWGRFPRARVVVRAVRVQGKGAASEIARAIDELNAWGGADVLIVGRGGGSLEDLWAFNEEMVARAIARSRVPVVSAVGHEVDVSISDLVADCRALTPSDAGVRVVPRLDELEAELDDASLRIARAARSRLASEREHVELLSRSYGLHAPTEHVARERQRLDDYAGRAELSMERELSSGREGLSGLSGRLEELSPLSVLARGYSVTSRIDRAGEVVRDASTLSPGERIATRFARGETESVVEKVHSGRRTNVIQQG
jgi:exodeoxyribonuclease VII large subunit